MKVRCAWHKPPKIIGEKEGERPSDVTDGICDDCLAEYFPSIYNAVLRLNIKQEDRYPDGQSSYN